MADSDRVLLQPAERVRLGIVQGRLIQSPLGELQWFPQDHWEAEFSLAAALGLDYIELIAERRHNPSNPIWTEAGRERIKELTARTGLSLYSFCNDFVVDNRLPRNRKVLKQNLRLIECGGRLGCEKYVLPLFEQSGLTANDMDVYVGPLREIADAAAQYGMEVCLETTLNGAELMQTLETIRHPSVKVVYDTGNRVAFGHDVPGDIRLLSERIGHVHIKDKDSANQNVQLGTGLVNFRAVFEALAEIAYEGAFTFETHRGKDPVRTAAYNIGLVKYFHAEAFSP